MLQKLRAFVSFPLETMQANAPQNEAIGVVFVVSPWCIRFVALARSVRRRTPSIPPSLLHILFPSLRQSNRIRKSCFQLVRCFRSLSDRHSFSLAELRPLLEGNRYMERSCPRERHPMMRYCLQVEKLAGLRRGVRF